MGALSASQPAIRRAGAGDLAAIYEIWYANEVRGDPRPPPRGSDALLRHELAAAEVWVAELDGRVAGFAAAIERGPAVFLSECFVRAADQSRGVGRALVRQLLADRGPARCTLASRDPRALALYIRAGLRPRWPNFCLLADPPRAAALPADTVAVAEARPGDPALEEWDAAIGGRRRPDDLAYLVEHSAAIPLWFERAGRPIGYGYAQPRAPEELSRPGALALGPIGVRDPADALACVAAAARWAAGRAPAVRIGVPGPHPALPALLAAGFQITYVEQFLCSDGAPFFDPACYIPASSTLF